MKALRKLAKTHPVFPGSLPNQIVTYFVAPANEPFNAIPLKCFILLPDEFPAKSPSIGLQPMTIWHPNVDFSSGSVCLDVLNSAWNSQTSLESILDLQLPQLLLEPNFNDPLNTKATREEYKQVMAKILQKQPVVTQQEQLECPSFWERVDRRYLQPRKSNGFHFLADDVGGLGL